MRIAVGCDHAAFNHKKHIIDFLKSQGHTVVDFGCRSAESCDYPDRAADVAGAVTSGKADRGILMCGTGVGMSIAANKFPGIRAAVCWADEIAALVAEHNAANVLCMGARFATPEQMNRWIDIWLRTTASTEGRHVQRRDKIARLEEGSGGKP